MNRGRGYGTPRGRGQQSWRSVTADSSADRQPYVGADESPNGSMSSSPYRKSRGSSQARGNGSWGNDSKHCNNGTPPGHQIRGSGWSSGESYFGGGKSKQWKNSSESVSGSDVGHNIKSGWSSVKLGSRETGVSNEASEVTLPSSLEFDRSFMESVHLPDTLPLSEESDVSYTCSDSKGSETTEKLSDNENFKNSKHSILVERFDICPPRSSSVVVLKPSLLAKNREKRNEMKRTVDGPKGTILRSGMVLLKNYLSSSEQVNILRTCRSYGLGPAGFYQPRFRDGGKLHLKLMCFGEFWDPETNKYGELRPMDLVKPPSVPPEFLQLVDRAIKDSHFLIAEESRVKNVEDILPLVKPDICLVNYYATTGRLGLHQDKDESQESLGKRIPIVSFSIGDSAEFLYGDEGEVEKAEKVTLQSGDVLIFGGKSRHIFHGVSAILPDTALKSLFEQTNFRPGRLNLTFRQHR